jgi:hypothetical protein
MVKESGPFLEILERREPRFWDDIGSISYVDANGTFHSNPRRPRIIDLDEIPSPMLEGTYEDLMRAVPDQQWLATWETNRGCPFECAFCDWGSATAGKISRYGEQRIYEEIDWLALHGIHHLFVCDANFGMLSRDLDIARRIAESFVKHGSHVALSVQNTKNRTDRSEHIQRIFQQSRVVSFGASVSLQSADATVLKAIKRDNISLDAFDRLQKHYASEGLENYTDLIVGLPGESYESFAEGVGRVIRNGQRNRVAFYECSVLPNAPMATPEYRKAFKIETFPVRLVHVHQPVECDESEEQEAIDMVVSTSSMGREDWVRARVFAYFVELLFFDRVLHVPLILLETEPAFDYRRVIEAFLDADPLQFPILAATRRLFEDHVRSMLAGGPQYIASPEWLNVWWPPDQFALIHLAHGQLLGNFYAEATAMLTRYVQDAGGDFDPILIENSVRLNHAMFALPFELSDEIVETDYPVAEDYLAVLAGGRPQLRRRPAQCLVDRTATIWMSWNDWCEDLVRRIFSRKHFLYPIRPIGDCSPASPDKGELAAIHQANAPTPKDHEPADLPR